MEGNKRKAPRWFHGLRFVLGSLRVVVIGAIVIYCGVPDAWVVPAMILLNFGVGYTLGQVVAPIEVVMEEATEDLPATISNNEKALL